MTTETRTDPRNKFAPRFLPWLLAAASFALYWFTLNHWVSLFNLGCVAKVSGWTWQVDVANPVLFLVTYPFHWLPAPQIPLALNAFSAVCAALTLGLLARSVALLPHDRTDAQRRREHSDFSFLTINSAWLPPVLAVLVCGLQLTFWEHATNWTGEMFDLLLFALVIWLLLEYRLDEREWRLFLASFVYGAGMADNWAMVGFFPMFITAIIWIRGFSFFNLRFLKRMALCGLVGMTLYLLLPLLALISGKLSVTFWEALKYELSLPFSAIKAFIIARQIRYALGLLSLTSLIPVFVLSIRWGSSFGDNSRIGVALAGFMFSVVHGVILGVCLWAAFDPPFAPRHLGLGTPSLTLYYLGALSVGYFSGFFLLVFGKEPSSRNQLTLPPIVKFINRLVFVSVWVLAAVAATGLIYRNTPQIRAANDDTFRKYASLVEENLPRSGAFLLSDDSWRLFLVQAALTRDGRAKDFLLLDTHSLNSPVYFRFLHNKSPKKWPELVTAKELRPVSPLGLLGVLTMLAKTNEFYYLHPSFGYYFEQFYQEPRGLVCKLKTLPEDSLLPPLLDKNQIAGNEAFWSRAEMQAFAPIKCAVTPPDPNAPCSWGERLLISFHVPREQNQNAILAGTYYSRGLDYWGVQLQRADELEKAAAAFTLAKELNPDNVVAQINLQFNQSLRAGKSVPVDPSKATRDQFGKYHDWNEVLNANGPFDEPGFCLAEGILMAAQNKCLRQAAVTFARVRKLAPDNLEARLWLGQIYMMSRLPDRALEALHDPLEQPERFSLTKTNQTQLNIIAAVAYLQKNEIAQGTQLFETEIALHPNDENLLTYVVQTYLSYGLITNALTVIDRKLRLAPDDAAWIFNRGYISIQTKAYDDAIDAFTRVLATQTNNASALFNRALACLDSGKLDAARADYKTLQQQSLTNSFQVAFGLGEIAWRQHDTNEAIRNYKIYLANADTNTEEATNVMRRLRELKGHSP
jgi:tetratricopeptide (TPR) repeat protein